MTSDKNTPRRKSLLGRDNEFDVLLEAAEAAPDADRRVSLILRSPETAILHRASAAAALGGLHGSDGTSALREEFRDATARMAQTSSRTAKRMERDLICACVMALRKREGQKATDIYIAALEYPDLVVSDYGIGALASSGDDRAWETVIDLLKGRLKRRSSATGAAHSWTLSAIDYLSRHSQTDSQRADQLSMLLEGKPERI